MLKSNLTFLNLVKVHYKNNFKNQVLKYLEPEDYEERYEERFKNKSQIHVQDYLELIEDYELTKYCTCDDSVCQEDVVSRVLPGAKMLIDDCLYDIVYKGQECEAYSKRVYEYKNYYITSEFEGSGDDMDVLNYKHNYQGLVNFCKNQVKVYTKEDFAIHSFIGKSGNVEEMVKIYKKDGLPELKKYFNKYLETEWKAQK